MEPLTYSQVFEGRPTTKARPRVTRKGHAYTPIKTLEAEDRITEAYDGPSFDGLIVVELDYWPTHQQLTITEAQPHRPPSPLTGDIDNYIKLSLDALQKSDAFADDRQVVTIRANKFGADE